MKRKITTEHITQFKEHLQNEEKSAEKNKKYIRDVTAFFIRLKDKDIEKSNIIAYKEFLLKNYMTSSVNSILSSLNSFFSFLEWFELRVKTIKLQKQVFTKEERELSKSEYEKLLLSAKSKKNKRLFYVMQTICSTGIRISEDI